MPPPPRSGSLDLLLAEARWLEGLARALVRDREEARDLVQDVWTAAAEGAPERVDAPRAWLAAVLRNALGSRRRRAGVRRVEARLDSASDTRAAAASSAGDVVERAEAQRLLVESVLALDEPWRSTLLQHHFDGESCEAIARRTGVPASTVRNRLVEARARLRERLARGRDDWMSALLPLTLPPGAASAASTAGPIGVLLAVNTLTKLGVAAATVLLATGAWWTWKELAVAEPEAPSSTAFARGSTSTAPEEPAVAARQAPSARAPITESARTSPATAPTPRTTEPLPPGSLLVRVLEDDAPYTRGGTVRVGQGRGEDLVALRELALAPDGTARFDALEHPPGARLRSCTIRAEFENGAAVESADVVLPAEAGREVVLHVGSARVVGTVWDEHGNPVEGARILLLRSAADGRGVDELRAARTDGRGAYRIERLPAGKTHVQLHVDDPESVGRIARDEVAETELAVGEERRVDFGRPSASPAWTGRVLTRAGPAPVERVWVRLLRAKPYGSFGHRRAGPDGEFELHAPPGTYRAEVRFERDWERVTAFDDVVIGEPGLVRDLVLPGVRLHGRIATVSGAALPNEFAELQVSVRLEGHDYPAAFLSAGVARTGEFTLDGLPPGTYRFSTHPIELTPESDALRVVLTESDVFAESNLRVQAP